MSEKRAEELLAEKGAYTDTTAGTSMWPMLRHRHDTATVIPLRGAVKKYDVVLFRRTGQLVLHRVVKIVPNGYLIRGDHCLDGELVQENQLLGVLSAFTRNGKPHSVNAPGYVAYSRMVVWLHPVLSLIVRVRGLVKKALRRENH